MKALFAIIAAALVGICAPAAAWEIDITNHPDKDFLLGYKRNYPGDCDVMWWASHWDTEHIFSLGECKGISDERMYNDMMELMKHVKATTDHQNFSEYFREGDRIVRERSSPETLAMQEIPRRCLDTASGTYVFLPAASRHKSGWFYLSKLYNGQGVDSNIVGHWKKNRDGTLVADLGLNTVSVNMANVYPC